MRPNILWICTDQQRFDTIGALGNPHVHTPHIDRLVREGVSFTRTYCQNPMCTPSRASFMTGRYPGTIHVNSNGNEFFPPTAAETLVSRLLAAGGYDCGLVGKLHLAGAAERREPRVEDGFRYFQWSHSPRANWAPGDHDYADWIREQGLDPADVLRLRHRKKDRLLEPTAEDDNVPVHLHHLTWNRLKSTQYLTEATSPWLLCVNMFEPHPPFNPPWEYYRRFDPSAMPGPHYRESDIVFQSRLEEAGVYFQTHPGDPERIDQRKTQAAYYAMIEFLDHQIGALLGTLGETGQLENTVVVFMSDHGEMLGDHGLFNKGCRFYEGAVRVPLIWWGPRIFRRGVAVDDLVELTDVAPTLLELAGLDVPPRMQGRSLGDLLFGTSDHQPHRDYVRCEFYDSEATTMTSYSTMYLEGEWKLVDHHSAGIGELYNLRDDPWEHTDLWGEPSHRDLKYELTRKSFAATVLSQDSGPRRTMQY